MCERERAHTAVCRPGAAVPTSALHSRSSFAEHFEPLCAGRCPAVELEAAHTTVRHRQEPNRQRTEHTTVTGRGTAKPDDELLVLVLVDDVDDVVEGNDNERLG